MRHALSLMLALTLGCSGQGGTSPTASPAEATGTPGPSAPSGATATPGPSPTAPAQDGQAAATPVGDGAPIGHEDVELPPASAGTRRMTVAQLAASLPVVAGDDLEGEPITWTVALRGSQQPALDEQILGATLGAADYVVVTEENTEPHALYLKFMDDMARDVCGKILAADYDRADAGSRTFVRFADLDDLGSDQTDANLRYLSLRFLGVRVADDNTSDIYALRQLFDTVIVANPQLGRQGRASAAWGAVCVGLLLDPAFHIY